MHALRWVGVLGCVSVLGCGGDKAPPAPQPTAAPLDAGAGKGSNPTTQPEAPKADFSGRVTGLVRLAPGVSLPLAVLPAAGTKDTVIAPGCPEITKADAKRVTENAETHGLSPVHVALTGMSAAPPREPVTHNLVIQDCRLQPGLIAAQTGDTLRLTNRSTTAFLPVLPGDSFMQALLPEASREVPLSGIGPADVKCGFGSYCGESVILSVAHSLFAVTDSSGAFSIEGVPLDQELTVHAWHPLFEVSGAKFKLSAAEPHKQVELLLKPNASVAASPEAASSPAKKKR